MLTVCPSQFGTRRTLFHVLGGCRLLMLKVSCIRLPVIWRPISMWLFFFSSRRRHTRCSRDWSSDVCSSDLVVRCQGSAQSHIAPKQNNNSPTTVDTIIADFNPLAHLGVTLSRLWRRPALTDRKSVV